MGPTSGILVEAEAFDEHGGWVVDSQFESVMGSPYLLAHGLGRPVADATTTVTVTEAGEYGVWVRAKDWVPSHHPGRFTVSVHGTPLDGEFGADGRDWSWEHGGTVVLPRGDVVLALHDLTGFDGRCDAVYLGPPDRPPPADAPRAWRRRLLGLPDVPQDGGGFDLVVVGGGVSGCAAALAAARLGCRVALVQDRPVLGGNASTEIGLMPRGRSGSLVAELTERADDGELLARTVLDAEPTLHVLVEQRVVDVVTDGARIVAVDTRETRTGREFRYRAPVFVDATGTALLAVLSGARTLSGQEARSEYGESLAPRRRSTAHHGHTVFFRTRTADRPVPFPDVPWARAVSKGYANLGGQAPRPGVDNVAGPVAGRGPTAWFARTGAKGAPGRRLVARVLHRLPERLRMRLNMARFPGTHFWEYGQWLDPYTDGEHIRDHLLRALYGTFSTVKRREPVTWSNLVLDRVSHVPGQGEFHRVLGDHVLTENDIRDHTPFPDAVVENSGAFCLHHAGHRRYDFRLRSWTWDVRDGKPYAIPFRCLYSADVENLMMAGKHVSVTHVAGSSTKFMANGAQHGVAVGVAARLCTTYGTTPRGVHDAHLTELQETVRTLVG